MSEKSVARDLICDTSSNKALDPQSRTTKSIFGFSRVCSGSIVGWGPPQTIWTEYLDLIYLEIFRAVVIGLPVMTDRPTKHAPAFVHRSSSAFHPFGFTRK